MCDDNTSDPNKVSFMYDELINDSDSCESLKRRGKIFTFSFIAQVAMLMIGPIPGYDMYIQVELQKNVTVQY